MGPRCIPEGLESYKAKKFKKSTKKTKRDYANEPTIQPSVSSESQSAALHQLLSTPLQPLTLGSPPTSTQPLTPGSKYSAFYTRRPATCSSLGFVDLTVDDRDCDSGIIDLTTDSD